MAGGKLEEDRGVGRPRADALRCSGPLNGTWNQNDVILFPVGNGTDSFASEGGGAPTPATTFDAKAGGLDLSRRGFFPTAGISCSPRKAMLRSSASTLDR
jgi:hypothetical protein